MNRDPFENERKQWAFARQWEKIYPPPGHVDHDPLQPKVDVTHDLTTPFDLRRAGHRLWKAISKCPVCTDYKNAGEKLCDVHQLPFDLLIIARENRDALIRLRAQFTTGSWPTIDVLDSPRGAVNDETQDALVHATNILGKVVD